MNLHRNQSCLLQRLILLCIVHRLQIIDPQLNATTFTTNPVPIPVLRLQGLCQLLAIRSRQDFVAAGFVIQRAPVALPQIRW